MIFAALAVALGATFCSWVSLSQGQTRPGGDWGNFLTFVQSLGPSFYVVLFLTTAFVAGFIFYAMWRRPGGRSAHESVKTEWAVTRFRRTAVESRARDETSPWPKKRE